MLKNNKIILVLLLTIFCLSIGSVCATDIDDSISNEQIIVDNTKINNEEIVSEDINDVKINNEKVATENTNISKVNAADKSLEDNKKNQEVVKVSSSNSYENLTDIIDAANRYKKYIENNKKLPKTVRVGQNTYSHEDFTYLMAKAIKNINNGIYGTVEVKNLKSYNPLKYDVCVNLTKNRYVFLASFDLDWVVKNNKHPNYVNLSEAKYIRYDTYSYGFSKILVWYNEHGKTLPGTCLFDSSVFGPNPSGDTVTINQILAAAKNYQTFVKKNHKLPETVTVGNKKYTKQQFTYAMAQAIYQLNNGNKKDITIPSSVKMCTLNTNTCNRNYTQYQYADFARIVAEYVKENASVPSYVKYAGTVVPHIAYANAFANILSFYKDNGRLASQALFTTNGLKYRSAVPTDPDEGLNPNGVDADALKESQNSVGSNNNSKNLPATGNPILVLLFALAVLPILRIKK